MLAELQCQNFVHEHVSNIHGARIKSLTQHPKTTTTWHNTNALAGALHIRGFDQLYPAHPAATITFNTSV